MTLPWFCTPWGIVGRMLGVPRSGPTPAEQRQIDRMAQSLSWRVRRAFEAFSAPGVAAALAADFAAIAPAATVVHSWAALVRRVINQVEARWGPGTGPLKARVAQAAILRMVYRLDLHIAGLPDAFAPVAYDFMIRASVEAIVALHNANGLWDTAAARPIAVSAPGRLWIRLRTSLGRWLERLAWRQIVRLHRLDPDIEAEIDAAVDPQMLEVVRRGFAAALRLIAGAGVDGSFVRAAVEAVSVAVRDAEVMSGWDGSAKRAFATELVLAMMEDFDWLPEGAWYRGAVEWMLGIAIDITVEQLNLGDPTWNHAPLERRRAPAAAAR